MPQDEKWTKMINGMKIYTSKQLVAALKEAGFTEIKTYSNAKKSLDKYCCNEIANFKFDEEVLYMKKKYIKDYRCDNADCSYCIYNVCIKPSRKEFPLGTIQITWLLYGVYFLVAVVLLIAPRIKK